MKVTSYIWIGDVRHEFSTLEEEVRKDCAIKMQLQALKAIGRRPKDFWLLKNPEYAEYWERL